MELLYQYEEYLSNYSKTTQKTYISCIREYLRYLKQVKDIRPITICNVTRADIYNYIAYMDKLSKGTKKVYISAIKNFYNFIEPKLSHKLFEDIKLYSTNKKLPYCLTWCETKLLLNYYKDKRNKLIIYLLLTTGIRLNEIANIEVKNINLDEKYIRLVCKGNKTRNILINEKTKQMIMDLEPKEKLFNLSKNQIYKIVKTALVNLGLKGSTHTLRHTSASIMYKHTRDILIVKEFLGHERITTTQIYTHLDNEEVRNAVNKNPLAEWGC